MKQILGFLLIFAEHVDTMLVPTKNNGTNQFLE